ncbi:coiled-coil domain-containing protein 174 [Leguminivora glycinivorella]|uniref:coiled-coil domain-containing protein 174 n=1 Tax=Leguminivora glycinivorella TaxID=1035111 RepID=UPI00200F10FD|nr:coiled-coil domain-containing protein 174 [Leguminivora glycinivorella]XP_047988794.1 coiled-coil domain-containing protein 174 [Leguminivora glycinivorella]
MNDKGSKKISFNKSSLLSLKAELLKKQEEVHERKHLPQHRVEHYKPPVAKTSSKNDKGQERRTLKDNLKANDSEELEACRKAKQALEKKAELYNHLADSSGNSELSGRFLVDFQSKKQQESEQEQSPPPDNDVYQSVEDDDNEWTEFTDCLGRTRKCLKSDLELFVKRDQELMRAMAREQEGTKDGASQNEAPQVEKSLLMQKTNDYLQSLREKWDQKERELLAKDKDIHYQDLLFDEARIHGVGYFSFSTDEAERRKQMEELARSRAETLAAQQEAERRRARRDRLLAARVAAARARQRARAGLPPEEPIKEDEKDFTTHLLEFLTQQKDEAEAAAKEKEKKLKEEQERERQKLREAYVREWDIGKDGVEGKLKKFREMTQEEYVEQQRAKRIDEFAPVQGSSRDRSNYFFDDKGNMVSSDGSPPSRNSRSGERPKVKTPPPPTWSDVRPVRNDSPPPVISDFEPEQKGLYFTSKKSIPKHNVKYKNFVKTSEPTPIQNEISDDEVEERQNDTEKRSHDSSHAQIAPPPTYDYYGPVPKKAKNHKPFESDIREAYAQGSKSLEPKSSRERIPPNYDFTFD